MVAIVFGNGDVVFDFARFGFIQIVQCAQGGVAGGDVVHHHTESVDVHHFGKAQVFGLHFAVNAKQVFLTPFDLRFDIGAHQTLAEGAQHFAHHVAAVAARGLNGLFQYRMA